jgi:putative tryptophan/tyrosine transport system substrate-binding protein
MNVMKRRDLLTLAAGAAGAWTVPALAQQAKMPTLGVLVIAMPGSEKFLQLFEKDMRELGYVEGQSVHFEFRQGPLSGLPELAAELVRLKVDLIVIGGTPAALAAKQATSDIPIVMAFAGNPVEAGLVVSLARPGGNITGMARFTAELAGKCVALIREMLPAAHRVAVLVNAPDPFSKPFLEQIRLAGAATGTAIEPIMIHSSEELDAVFPTMEKDRPDAVIVQPSLPMKRAAELALQHRLPAVSITRTFVDAGGLMSYSADDADTYRRAAIIVNKVLKGAKPADLPVEQPTKFDLVIDLKTATALGLTISPAFLGRVDEVIE